MPLGPRKRITDCCCLLGPPLFISPLALPSLPLPEPLLPSPWGAIWAGWLPPGWT